MFLFGGGQTPLSQQSLYGLRPYFLLMCLDSILKVLLVYHFPKITVKLFSFQSFLLHNFTISFFQTFL